MDKMASSEGNTEGQNEEQMKEEEEGKLAHL